MKTIIIDIRTYTVSVAARHGRRDLEGDLGGRGEGVEGLCVRTDAWW